MHAHGSSSSAARHKHGAPPAVRRLHTNQPVCVLKARANSSCVPTSHAHKVTRAVGGGGSIPLNELMANAIGGWRPVRNSSTTWNTTHEAFGFPRGVRYLETSGHINHELGRDHAWLPVTHTRTAQDSLQVGLWFHYMRGCSDFAWNVGRTLLARNKCHAAVLLGQRVDNASWAVATLRVVRKLALAVERVSFEPAWRLWYKPWMNTTSLDRAEARSALHACAHGRPLDGVSEIVRTLIASNVLDYISAVTIAEDLPADRMVDTVQMVNACERESHDCDNDGNVEIWDVRSLHGANMSALRAHADAKEHLLARHPMYAGRSRQDPIIRMSAREDAQRLPKDPPLFGNLDGSRCKLTPRWFTCLACASSRSELACAFKCSLVGRRTFVLAPTVDSFDYGPRLDRNDSAFFASLGQRVSVLSLATLWRLFWGPLVGSVPR